jgi:hypothetical protein
MRERSTQRELAVFPRVKDPQNEYVRVRQLISNFVISDQHTPNFARIELRQTNTQSRMGRDALCPGHQLTYQLDGSSRING